ncbi:MAG: patatin-like phospholipase family protein [Muribaculaceae bacterium]|nr:patatin-like phospholipase family protein [Muribaculaceae bacterium]
MQITLPNLPGRKPFKTGVALSGGGARGFAHAGALQALEDMGVKPDLLAGVSAGSVVCVLYAAGMTPMDIVKVFSEATFSDFARPTVPRDGLFKLDGFQAFLKRHLGDYKRLEELPIKTVVGVTDLNRCEAAMFETGEITERVIASCSIPLVFKPREIDGVTYVDGGVLHNLPAWTIRDRCRYLVGINCSPMAREEYQPSLLEVAHRTYNMMAKHNVTADLALCDLAIEVLDIANYQVFNLKEIKRVYRAGYEAAVKALTDAGFKSGADSRPRQRFRFKF